MKLAGLSLRYLLSRPLQAALNLLLLTLGLGSITFVLLAGTQVQRAFERDLAGIDAVVGAKGSPMQLILSGVFHLDVPTGNVPLAEVKALSQHPQVAQVIPLSLGDSFEGFRIAGTTPDYMAHYQLRAEQGRIWQQPMEAVLGAQAAAATGLSPGGRFVGNHGIAGSGEGHGSTPYQVSGVLAPCGCVADRLVLTSLESVWQVHEHHGADEEDRKAMEAEREVTVALVRYRTPLAAVTFPRYINSTTGMQAASPAVEVSRLLRMLGIGGDVLRAVGFVLLLTAGLSVFIALWNAVRERRADLAMLRMLGAPPGRLAALLVCEALWLALAASVLGLLAGHALMALAGGLLAERQSLPLSAAVLLPQEIWIPALAVAVAVVSALVPAIGAYRADAGELLNTR
ncbi:ABC transporter permease [Ramlibacter henchirensis]|uniref:ABC transporter permease n=1 Tax=Ramlibacter henchirensis TaxID=204072 RepID=A0A4Z0C2X2_9BURK|nr:FtsX-like permease family protein [Ramlibacter henchirensis]TFZ06007.1 ABC transporter permease [Ramlibacter henchirensis]